MRAIWLVRDNLEQHPGGDTTQILATADALRGRGASITLSSESKPDLSNFDVVHLFHLDRTWETVPWCQQIRAARRPSVLSPIYWPSDEFDQNGRMGAQGFVSRMGAGDAYQSARIAQRALLPLLTRMDTSGLHRRVLSFEKSARFVLDTVDVVLPNSHSERDQMERHFGRSLKALEIPNAVDAELFEPVPEVGRESNQVLCVGRIEPRKNQLALIRAIRDTTLELTLVGLPGRFNRRYLRRCRRAAHDRVRILTWRPTAELGALYRAAHLHASVSW